jgi:dihydrofolate reductase
VAGLDAADPDAAGPDESGPDMRLGLIWAQTTSGIIGADGEMPWHLPEDLAHFKSLTLGSPVVMGRKTWDALPPRFRPLVDRRNIVVTRQVGWGAEGAEVAHSVSGALDLVAVEPFAWVIGGGQLYAAAIERADRVEVTEIRQEFAGDTRAPAIPPGWRAASVEPETGWATSRTGLDYRFLRYERD